MERRDCQVIVYFVVALLASLGLGLAIAYLEVKRSQEIVALEIKWLGELDKMQKEIDSLKEELRNKTSTLTDTVSTLQHGRPEGEDDYYYDEEYEDEEADDEETEVKESKGKEGGEGRRRTRREIGRTPIIAPYNLILRQYKPQINRTGREIGRTPIIAPYSLILRQYKPQINRTGPPEVKAKIIIATDQRLGHEIEPETYDKPQKPTFGSGVAIHFTGDTSKIRHAGRHHAARCYDANHRMCHARGIFKDWMPTSWTVRDDTFTMRDGELTLNRYPGIYYLYAQIFYADNHDVNGYRIYVNGSPVFQCTLTNLHDERWIPGRVSHIKNSCFTGGLIQLNEGDHIAIREIDNVERYSVFEPYKSYFGLFQVISLPSRRSKR